MSAMDYEVVIGLEVHVQLSTKSKMFCSCSADYQDAPSNTFVCPVCLGMPGVLPVINRRAVECVMKTGLALGCTIARHTNFDRKNYPYPDLMKGYQISQYANPIASGGCLTIEADGYERPANITRVHLEEDTARLVHRTAQYGDGYSLLDVNRSGVPLMEVVSEPDMRSAEEARSYLMRLRSILRYIGVSTANMEEGSFRCDANISVRPIGSAELGAKVEVKNMNSFRSVYRALVYEAARQIEAVGKGARIVQETRGWVEDRGVTVSQRTKEYASDYRYFPEPDLPPLVIDDEWIERVRESLPELPEARKARFVEQYGLSDKDANLLTATRDRAEFFETLMRLKELNGEPRGRFAKTVSNWMLGEWSSVIDLSKPRLKKLNVDLKHYIELLDLIDDGTVSTSMARTVSQEMAKTTKSPKQILKDAGMVQLSDTESVRPAVDEAVASNPQPVADYLEGKETAMRFLVGQVMKITRGKANPKLVSDLLREKLESLR